MEVTGSGRLITMNKGGEKTKIQYVADDTRLDKIQETRKNKWREMGIDPDNPVFKVDEDYEREQEIQEAAADGRQMSDMDS